jgi:hypothetical protein
MRAESSRLFGATIFAYEDGAEKAGTSLLARPFRFPYRAQIQSLAWFLFLHIISKKLIN